MANPLPTISHLSQRMAEVASSHLTRAQPLVPYRRKLPCGNCRRRKRTCVAPDGGQPFPCSTCTKAGFRCDGPATNQRKALVPRSAGRKDDDQALCTHSSFELVTVSPSTAIAISPSSLTEQLNGARLGGALIYHLLNCAAEHNGATYVRPEQMQEVANPTMTKSSTTLLDITVAILLPLGVRTSSHSMIIGNQTSSGHMEAPSRRRSAFETLVGRAVTAADQSDLFTVASLANIELLELLVWSIPFDHPETVRILQQMDEHRWTLLNDPTTSEQDIKELNRECLGSIISLDASYAMKGKRPLAFSDELIKTRYNWSLQSAIPRVQQHLVIFEKNAEDNLDEPDAETVSLFLEDVELITARRLVQFRYALRKSPDQTSKLLPKCIKLAQYAKLLFSKAEGFLQTKSNAAWQRSFGISVRFLAMVGQHLASLLRGIEESTTSKEQLLFLREACEFWEVKGIVNLISRAKEEAFKAGQLKSSVICGAVPILIRSLQEKGLQDYHGGAVVTEEDVFQ
ncbi:hypothetical protein T439DRAFT_383357 [Meredithblackwellia eburnea MCA 4105]